MAAGLPIVTTGVSGIGSLITHEENGLLIDEASPRRGGQARSRLLIDQPALRQRLIQGGYATARAHTLERQAAEMMRVVSARTAAADPGAARRMKICFVIPSLTGGGAERVAVTVLSALDGAPLRANAVCLFSANEGVYFDHIAPGHPCGRRDAPIVARPAVGAGRVLRDRRVPTS